MDEPFAALDALLRLRMQQLLVDIWAETRRTIVYVTHDLAEAVGLAHRIVIISHRPGRILRIEDVPIPHPRTVADLRTSPEFIRLYDNLWHVLSRELEVRPARDE
jgi:NitT/TauT family transport system ATP-binding protein